MVLLDKSRATMPKAPLFWVWWITKYGFRMIRRWNIRHELTIWISWSMLIWWPDSDLTGVGMMQWIVNVFRIKLYSFDSYLLWVLKPGSEWYTPPYCVVFFLMDQSSSMLLMPCQLSGLVRFKTHPAKATGGISKQTRPNFRFCFCVDTLW